LLDMTISTLFFSLWWIDVRDTI